MALRKTLTWWPAGPGVPWSPEAALLSLLLSLLRRRKINQAGGI